MADITVGAWTNAAAIYTAAQHKQYIYDAGTGAARGYVTFGDNAPTPKATKLDEFDWLRGRVNELLWQSPKGRTDDLRSAFITAQTGFVSLA